MKGGRWYRLPSCISLLHMHDMVRMAPGEEDRVTAVQTPSAGMTKVARVAGRPRKNGDGPSSYVPAEGHTANQP